MLIAISAFPKANVHAKTLSEKPAPFVLLTEQNYEKVIKDGRAAFLQFGLGGTYKPEFTKKYKIGIWNQGCVISKESDKIATTNNKLLARYLTKKYGNTWKKDLGFTPFGIE